MSLRYSALTVSNHNFFSHCRISLTRFRRLQYCILQNNRLVHVCDYIVGITFLNVDKLSHTLNYLQLVYAVADISFYLNQQRT